MKKSLLICLLATITFTSFAQTIVSVEHLESYTKQTLIASFFGVGFENGVEEYKVVYNTTDINGNPTVASGAMYIPWGCSNFPMGVYQHGTVFDPESVPSRGEEPIGLALAGFGYATIAPDYLGLGDNPTNVHPYLHAETQARVTADLIRAARTYIADSIGLAHNGELFITGYSQGGHAAMAFHKYIEDNSLLSEFNVIASAPLSGPYDLAGIQTALPLDSTYSVPAYLPYLVESMQLAYGNLYTNKSEVYQSNYVGLMDSYTNGTNTMQQISNSFPSNVYDFMQPTFLDAFNADTVVPYTTPFRIALSQNANFDWTPIRPIRMVYCTADEQVYYQNALKTEATMTANGATDVEAVLGVAGGTHSSCFFPALLYTLSYFNGLKTDCVAFPTSTNAVNYNEAVSITPNPSSGLIQLDLSELATTEALNIRLFNLSGQLIQTTSTNGKALVQLNLTDLPKGLYILKLDNETIRIQRKIIIE